MSADRGPQDPEIHPGVREIEHTADLGMQVEAETLEQLFDRAAAGMMTLVRGDVGSEFPRAGEEHDEPEDVERVVELGSEGGDIAGLLVRWLRELLYLQEVDGFVYGEAEFQRLDEAGLRAKVRRDPAPAPQIRELKGVTYHGLEVGRPRVDGAGPGDRAWRARVIFDI